MAWDLKYRPRLFSEIVGQHAVIEVLKNRLTGGKAFQTSYVFQGPKGSGKTTTARIMARTMLCERRKEGEVEPCNECESCTELLETGKTFAFKEMDASNMGAGSSKVEAVQAIVSSNDYETFSGQRRLWLIDESHRLSKAAQDGFLKPMEDNIPGSPDKRMVCFFCTTEGGNMATTIKSRATVLSIRRPNKALQVERLAYICEQEGLKYESKALEMIHDVAEGHVRDAVNSLERVALGGEVNKETVTDFLDLGVFNLYARLLLAVSVDPSGALNCLDKILEIVDVGDAYKGITDMAMTSYRVGKGLKDIPSYLDRNVLGGIYTTLGDRLIQIAGLLSQRHQRSTRAMLSCDLITLAEPVDSFIPALAAPSLGERGPSTSAMAVTAPPVAVPAPAPVVALPDVVATEASTEASMEASTEASTEASMEASTEASTEASNVVNSARTTFRDRDRLKNVAPLGGTENVVLLEDHISYDVFVKALSQGTRSLLRDYRDPPTMGGS